MDDILAPLQNAFEGQIVFFAPLPSSFHTTPSIPQYPFARSEPQLPELPANYHSPQDFHGQRLADILSTVLLIISGAVSFLTGYIYKDIYLTLWTGLAGTLLTALVVIPPWPMYNQHPEKWLGTARKGGPTVLVDGVKVA
ncbi:uncharacterized protein N7482_004743 [Penicillium canariense]|uniref:Signal peptidase complex subunit 1 n=1 Tax=Penicillium canariense TaxID=189055 RepID=A0A9W9LPN7_9EURO|nr:uncharacterized protein N7482_004743 [Penicillium canariense]KAJ5169149.1 hypothetical protein N7482_004743 [Penicillium canariense]